MTRRISLVALAATVGLLLPASAQDVRQEVDTATLNGNWSDAGRS